VTSYGKLLADYIVRWASDDKRSVAEDELHRLSQSFEQQRNVATALSPDDRRRTPRYALKVKFQMTAGGAFSLAEILDISQTGVRFVSASPCRPGEIVRLFLPDTQGINARVVWTDGECYGAQFVGLGIQQTRQVSHFIASQVL
jgi:hypothetical protein